MFGDAWNQISKHHFLNSFTFFCRGKSLYFFFINIFLMLFFSPLYRYFYLFTPRFFSILSFLLYILSNISLKKKKKWHFSTAFFLKYRKNDRPPRHFFSSNRSRVETAVLRTIRPQRKKGKRRELLSRNRVACINFMRYLYWIFLESERYFLPLCRIPRAIHQRLAATKRFRFYSSRRGFPIRRPMQTSTTTFTMSSVAIDV